MNDSVDAASVSDSVGTANQMPTRRTLIAGAAWSMPVIAGMTATPAFAASSSPPAAAKLVWENLTAWRKSGPKIGGTFGVRIAHPGLTATASVTLYLYEKKGNGRELVETLNLGPYTLATSSGQKSFDFTSTLDNGKKYTVVGIVSGKLASWIDDSISKTYRGSWDLAAVQETSAEVHVTGNW